MSEKDNSWKRTFLVIWTGQVFSILGSAAAQFAVVWWLAVQTGSPMVLALASMAFYLPMALIGPFAGVVVDRVSRKTVMIGADLFIAAASAVLAIGFWLGTPPTWLIYLILFLRAVGASFHTPALQAAMPMLVPESELVRTGGWGQFLQSGCFMLGPVLGTALMSSFSIPAVMLIDIVGAVLASACLLLVRIPDPEPSGGEKQSVLGDMREGLAEIAGHRLLKAISVPVMLTAIVFGPVGSLFPLMVNGHFQGTAWHASAIEFLFAGGMLSSSLVLGVWGGLKDKFLMINLALGLLGMTLIASGALPPSGFIAFAVLCVMMGLSGNFFSVPYMAYVQSTIPPAALGRVLGLITSMMSLAIPFGLLLTGPLAKVVGVNWWFFVSGWLILLSAVLGQVLVRSAQKLVERVSE